ncbi:hypothetical protein MCOR25_001791 [Pyricularia grisea]|nr:hypothetical protein MCOR25_001791 [Pyricularia grisea]
MRFPVVFHVLTALTLSASVFGAPVPSPLGESSGRAAVTAELGQSRSGSGIGRSSSIPATDQEEGRLDLDEAGKDKKKGRFSEVCRNVHYNARYFCDKNFRERQYSITENKDYHEWLKDNKPYHHGVYNKSGDTITSGDLEKLFPKYPSGRSATHN